jgi:hypothetical protein
MKTILFLLCVGQALSLSAQPWQFAVAGDSRNCGDVVMPSIANSAKAAGAQFYWHLGDFRKISDFDEDMLAAAAVQKKKLAISDYEKTAWSDFITNQANRFQIPVYLGIGNHETTSPKTKPDWTLQFADWLMKPNIVQQRLADNPSDHLLRAYYHWIQNGVDFWNLDNAAYTFDSDQMSWISKRVAYVKAHPEITTVIVGMHAALPHSLSCDHSMNQTADGERTGVVVYKQLLDLQKAGKKIYVFASHSHYKLENIFDTDYWRNNGGVLPGWIVGTAGAQRYRLPDTAAGMPLSRAQTDVYGYYLVTVAANGSITVEFREVKRGEVPHDVEQTFGAAGVDRCYAENQDDHVAKSANCAANVPCGMP